MGDSGYIDLPGGLKQQFGVIREMNFQQTYKYVTFPVAFKEYFLSATAIITHRHGGTSAGGRWANGSQGVQFDNATLYGMEVGVDHDHSSGEYGDVYWTAIGK